MPSPIGGLISGIGLPNLGAELTGGVGAPSLGAELTGGAREAAGNQKTFGEFLTEAIGDVNQRQNEAGQMVERYATGEQIDVHQVMIAMEQAGTALQLTTQVRNKVVEAYQEVMRIQV